MKRHTRDIYGAGRSFPFIIAVIWFAHNIFDESTLIIDRRDIAFLVIVNSQFDNQGTYFLQGQFC